MGKDQLILGGEGVEFVGGGHKVLAGETGHGGGHFGVKTLGGVEAGAHGSAAQGQLLQGRQGQLQQLPVPFQAGPPAGDLLGEGDGSGVLQVGAAGFDDPGVGLFQTAEGGGETVNGREDPVLQGRDSGDVHGGGEGVVGGLGHVDVIVGVE